MDNKVLAIGVVAVAVGAISLVVMNNGEETQGGVSLEEGWNYVTYQGEEKAAGVMFESIEEYFVFAYYWDPLQNLWLQITYDVVAVPGMKISVQVSEACFWEW